MRVVLPSLRLPLLLLSPFSPPFRSFDIFVNSSASLFLNGSVGLMHCQALRPIQGLYLFFIFMLVVMSLNVLSTPRLLHLYCF